jgi:hypothetical protein
MPFNINTFKANVEDFGYLKNHSFQVFILPPPSLFNTTVSSFNSAMAASQLSRIQTFRIDQIKAPGVSLMSADLNRYGVGTTQKNPYGAQLQEISFSVLNDENSDIWNYWHNWLKSIYDFTGSDSNSFGEINAFPSYEVGYKSEYSTTVQIVIYNQFGEVAQRINLYEAFPGAIREVPLAWGDTGNLMRLGISFLYSYYTISSSELILPY